MPIQTAASGDPAHHAVHDAAIALGSNLGDRQSSLDQALARLAATPGIELVRASAPLETAPVGPVPQGPYLNAAALVRTTLSPRALLDQLLRIEAEMGRTRDVRWGPRVIDLDLLLFGDQVLSLPGLIVPHPRLAERAFVLAPLAEIAPTWRVPPSGRTILELLHSLPRNT